MDQFDTIEYRRQCGGSVGLVALAGLTRCTFGGSEVVRSADKAGQATLVRVVKRIHPQTIRETAAFMMALNQDPKQVRIHAAGKVITPCADKHGADLRMLAGDLATELAALKILADVVQQRAEDNRLIFASLLRSHFVAPISHRADRADNLDPLPGAQAAALPLWTLVQSDPISQPEVRAHI